MKDDIEKIMKEQSDLNGRINFIVKSLNSEYSDAVSDEIEKLYSNDSELEKSIDAMGAAARSMESVLEQMNEKLDSVLGKMKYIEDNNDRTSMQLDMLESRLSVSEKMKDRNEIEEAVRKIRREA